MKILIIIPVFNEEKNLERCLKSFLKQTDPITQITVVNDGSTDGTNNILNNYSKKYNTINYLSKIDSDPYPKPGSKIIKAFNYGLERSTKDYDLIGKFDGDIELPKNYFENMVNIFANNKNIGLASGLLSTYKNNSWEIENLYEKTHIRGGLKLYNKSTFKKINGLTESMGWDSLDELKIHFFNIDLYIDDSLVCKQLRKTGERYSDKMFYKQGRVMYLLGYDFILCFLGSVKFSIKHLSILPFFQSTYGYLKCLTNKEQKIVSNKFSKFVKRYRYQMILKKIYKWGKF